MRIGRDSAFNAAVVTVVSVPCQQILQVAGIAPTGTRVKDICLALGVESSPKHVEGAGGLCPEFRDSAVQGRQLGKESHA